MYTEDAIRRLCDALHQRYTAHFGELDIPVDQRRLAELVRAQVIEAEIPVEGSVAGRGDERIIQVSTSIPSRKRRFIVAHEVVHILLGDEAGWVHPGVAEYRSRERLVDAGAAFLLIPEQSLTQDLRSSESLSLRWFLETAIRYDVPISSLARRSLRDREIPRPTLVLKCAYKDAAERARGALRVRTAVGTGHWFVPSNIKTEKLGLGVLQRAAAAPLGERVAGREDFFAKVYRGATGGDWRSERVIVEAMRLGSEGDSTVLAVIRAQ